MSNICFPFPVLIFYKLNCSDRRCFSKLCLLILYLLATGLILTTHLPAVTEDVSVRLALLILTELVLASLTGRSLAQFLGTWAMHFSWQL